MKTTTQTQRGGEPAGARGLLLLALPVAVPAQDYTYITNNNAITITGYTGPNGAVSIPDTIDGLPVTSDSSLHQPGQRHHPQQRHRHRELGVWSLHHPLK